MKNLFILIAAVLPLVVMGQAPPPKTIQEAAVGSLMYSESRVIQLAEAIPADKYDWRPDEGVRSIGESMLHLASANYFMPMTAGHTPPEGVDIMTLEKSIKGKDKIISVVKESYNYAREGIAAMTDDQLDDIVEFPFPGEFNKRSTMMILTGHCEEHMGQLIAYARMNGIVPPWSE